MYINEEYQSKNFRSRADESVLFLVLHYTAVPLATTLAIFTNNSELAEKDAEYFVNTETDLLALCKNEVSAHYVNSESGEIFQLVDEEFASFHAGLSFWDGVRNINNHSIGIEHENIGYDWLNKFPHERSKEVLGSDKLWCRFTEAQIQATIELCQKIIRQHGIKPYNVVGHSDVSCGRKSDPGPLFPWQRLAEAGIGLWYDISESVFKDDVLPENFVTIMQTKLAEFGYDCPITGIYDETTASVVKSFQIHFRQNNIDGQIDLESLQIIDSLCGRKLVYKKQEELEIGSADSMVSQFNNSCIQTSTEVVAINLACLKNVPLP